MTGGVRAYGRADKRYQMVARRPCVRLRARMARAAAAIGFAGSDAGQPYARTFGAPDRTVAIPYGDGRADKALAGRDSGQKEQEKRHAHC